MMRMLLPARLKSFMFPTSQHVNILKQIYCQILDGYRNRNPFDPQTQRLLHGGDAGTFNFERVIDSQASRPATISLLTGLSGMGKTTLIRSVMGALGKPVIQHSNYQGMEFTESQILYLMRNVPDQCTPRILCQKYGDYTDSLLAIKLYSKPFKSYLSRSDYVKELKKIITNHHVGALILDEFHNLLLAGKDGVKELIAMLINFRDELGVPIILVGTYRTSELLDVGGDSSITRRLVEGGFHELKRPGKSSDAEWKALCEIVWKYQWVKDPIDITDGIVKTLYDCSQGITGIMLTLFIAAQMYAIDTGLERVDAKLLKKIYQERFKPLHRIINALKSNELEFLNQYDDLYFKCFAELKKDTYVSRMTEIQREVERGMEANVGIINEDSEVNKEKRVDTQKSSRSAADLLKEVESTQNILQDLFS